VAVLVPADLGVAARRLLLEEGQALRSDLGGELGWCAVAVEQRQPDLYEGEVIFLPPSVCRMDNH
jgi:hypothetical protein